VLSLKRRHTDLCIIQVFTGTSPFSDIADAGVIIKLSQNKRPQKPEGAFQLGLTDPIWGTVEMCWKTRPLDRPTATGLLEIWEKEINGGGVPAIREQGGQRLSRILNGFSAGIKSALSLCLRLSWLMNSTIGKGTPWSKFVCGGSGEQYA
jgi:hypothetical protein